MEYSEDELRLLIERHDEHEDYYRAQLAKLTIRPYEMPYAWDHTGCLCEHEDHFEEDGPAAIHVLHPYGAILPVFYWCTQITGPVCQGCADGCLAEWRRDHPDDVVRLPSRPSLTAPGAGES